MKFSKCITGCISIGLCCGILYESAHFYKHHFVTNEHTHESYLTVPTGKSIIAAETTSIFYNGFTDQ